MVRWITAQHERYGEAVRVAPDEVSFISGETAWQQIYGFHAGKQKSLQFLKDPVWFGYSEESKLSIGSALPEDHTRMRRSMSHAFSDRAIRQQLPLILEYIGSLIDGLREQARSESNIVDLERWYSWTNFDLTGHLTFGESFGCLSKRADNNFNRIVSKLDSAATHLVASNYFTITKWFPSWIFPQSMIELMNLRHEVLKHMQDLVRRRLDREVTQPDFMTEIAKDRGENGLSFPEMEMNSLFLMVAGAETPSTALAATTYLLLKNPDKLEKLRSEVRDTFGNTSVNDLDKLVGLPYLNAVINEGLRFFPPIPTGLPRVVPPGGATISGRYIPQGTAVYMSQYPANHSSRNFTNPNAFVPERWLGGHAYANDKREVVKPFAYGPRNCVGMNLALAQMRLILAKMTLAFDLELVHPERDWLDQKSFTVWEKNPLTVRVSEAK
ncbi:uncharacterized protein A1O5_13267 [Cladophialophora psammophila CBS 110553]|uniref:Cytochrome P450 oxidoreductase n=1 Tax=Cladophialophora psammophila CBS 110553 TaxID=1182543 RepID=W9VMY0_9EURO|nr:uncharacterized protein A1O5_13267 [Cladophialophora psammophila CBS 110553]EXJ53491.1 hypothetical protein A1O5_13267 [Cladophialophora psammophila CBS 110553]